MDGGGNGNFCSCMGGGGGVIRSKKMYSGQMTRGAELRDLRGLCRQWRADQAFD